MNVSEGQNWRKCKHTVKKRCWTFLYLEYSCYVIQTSKETVILRNQSKTCTYVRVEIDLEASWTPPGGGLGLLGRLGQVLARLGGVL